MRWRYFLPGREWKFNCNKKTFGYFSHLEKFETKMMADLLVL